MYIYICIYVHTYLYLSVAAQWKSQIPKPMRDLKRQTLGPSGGGRGWLSGLGLLPIGGLGFRVWGLEFRV